MSRPCNETDKAYLLRADCDPIGSVPSSPTFGTIVDPTTGAAVHVRDGDLSMEDNATRLLLEKLLLEVRALREQRLNEPVKDFSVDKL